MGREPVYPLNPFSNSTIFLQTQEHKSFNDIWKTVKIVYHPLMQEHYDRTPAGASGRLDSAVEILGTHPDYEFVEARPATEEEILRAHGTRTLDSVKHDYDSTRAGLLYKMATLAAGGSIMAADIAVQGEPSFGLVRPPGHHASGDSYWGFCYFNNIAVSQLHLRANGLIESAYIMACAFACLAERPMVWMRASSDLR